MRILSSGVYLRQSGGDDGRCFVVGRQDGPKGARIVLVYSPRLAGGTARPPASRELYNTIAALPLLKALKRALRGQSAEAVSLSSSDFSSGSSSAPVVSNVSTARSRSSMALVRTPNSVAAG